MLAFGLRHGYPIKYELQGVYNVLKGSDVVVYQSVHALGFEPVLHMYYEDDGPPTGTGVIVDDVVYFGDVFQEYTVSEIALAEGGILVQQDNGSIYKGPEQSEDSDPEPIQWVTPMTTYSRKEGVYVSHQDTYQMLSACGDLCMIVRIGKAGDRLAYPTNAQVKRAYLKSGYRRR
jgi:hypothetical protein